MKQFLQNLREQRWLMLLVLLGWLLPQQAVADDGYDTFVDQSYMYNIYVSGSNTVTISVPLYDQEGADCYIVDGNLYASWEGQSEINLFHWALNGGSIAGDKSTCPTMIYSQAPGYFNVTLGNTTGVTRLDPHDWKQVNVARNSDGTTFSLSAVWVFPKELLGKTKLLNTASVKLAATNLCLLYADKKLNGQDPEFINSGGVASPITKQFTATVRLGF